VEREQLYYCRLTVSYEEIGALLRQLESVGGEIIDTAYTAEASVIVALPYPVVGTMKERFNELSRGSGRWEPLEMSP